MLVFDTETHTPAGLGQQLLVGGYLLASWRDDLRAYQVEQRGLFLPGKAPADHRELVAHFAQTRSLKYLDQEEFTRLLLQEGYELGSLVVGFNLPFDLSRIAVRWAPGRKAYRTGFTLWLFDAFSAPRIRVRTGPSPRAFIEWSSWKGHRKREGGRQVFRGRFLDLRRWAYAMGWGKLSLEEACRVAGVNYRKRAVAYGSLSENLLEYLLEDVEATWQLYLQLREDWNRLPFTPIPSPPLRPGARAEDTVDLHPDAVLPHRLQSPAGVAKSLLHRMGVR
ncbi:MAG: hypothetical protein QN144_13670, partial [Armatimonadota bacterium]|nr:hypothetical protein [Armatimonadota bacterium]